MTEGLVGQRFSQLVIVSELPLVWRISRTGKMYRRVMVRVQCDCGNFREINLNSLRRKNTKSCGCGRHSPSVRAARSRALLVHAHARGGRITAEYRIWSGMKTRCNNKNNPAYDSYGGRGIKVCARWLAGFPAFLSDMGRRPSPSHSIDRINNDGDYEPGNCRWATSAEQAGNKRSAHTLTAMGRTQSILEWAKEIGAPPPTLYARARLGWADERIIREPIRTRPYQRKNRPIESLGAPA